MMKHLCLVSAVGLAASVAAAQGPAVVDFTGGSTFDIFYGGSTGDVVGFRFTADVDMVVTHLGLWDDNRGGGITSPHRVGIWRNSDQMLLGDTTVDSSGLHIGEFFFAPVAGIPLVAGERYTAGTMYTTNDPAGSDRYVSGPNSITLDGISGTVAVFPSAGDLGFVYPENETAGNPARLGPNFMWIPAPSSLALLGLGGLAAMRRRR